MGKQKEELRKQFQDKNTEKRKLKSEASAMEKKMESIGGKTEQEINDKIRQIEFEMQTSSLTLQQERKKLEEIKRLKQSKPKIETLQGLQAAVGHFSEQASQGIKENLDSLNQQY